MANKQTTNPLENIKLASGFGCMSFLDVSKVSFWSGHDWIGHASPRTVLHTLSFGEPGAYLLGSSRQASFLEREDSAPLQ